MTRSITGGWSRDILRNCHQQADKHQRVQAMFDHIAGTYDLLNHLLSFNLDRHWRAETARMAQPQPGQRLLDLCCGSGDLALAFQKAQPQLGPIVGVDFSVAMLDIARRKAPHIKWLEGDALNLDFPDDSFDQVTIGFGVRNLQDIQTGLKEVFRVLAPGGRLTILEFSLPANPVLKSIYACYSRLLLPLLARIVSGPNLNAYVYLAESIQQFDWDEMTEHVLGAGFTSVTIKHLSFGIVRTMAVDKS